MARYNLRAYEVTKHYFYKGESVDFNAVRALVLSDPDNLRMEESRQLIFNEFANKKSILLERYDRTVREVIKSGVYKPKGEIKFEWSQP